MAYAPLANNITDSNNKSKHNKSQFETALSKCKALYF
jgi:hypothetical protein